MMYRVVIALFLVSLMGLVHGQEKALQRTGQAARLYQEKDYQEAKRIIDECVLSEGAEDAYTWHVRGYVYKELLKGEKGFSDESTYREEAVRSFQQCLELDDEQKYLQWNTNSLRYLASTYWNGAVMIMEQRDRGELETAYGYFEKYCSIMKSLEQTEGLDDRKVDFYRAFSTANRKVIEKLRSQKSSPDSYKIEMERIEKSYTQALQLSPNDYGANYNYAINLYNEAAYRIENIPFDAPLTHVILEQEGCIDIFERALPFALKAEQLRPGRIEILKALRAIYLSLNNYGEFDRYNQLIRDKQGELLVPKGLKEGELNPEIFKGSNNYED